MGIFTNEGGRLIWSYDKETLLIEPWGENALRVRATKHRTIDERTSWALLETPGSTSSNITVDDQGGRIVNGNITAFVTPNGRVTFRNGRGEPLLREYWRQRDGGAGYQSMLRVEGRELKPILGGDFKLTARFEPNPGERLYGMGQYQQPLLNLKGASLELAQRNSQASVPFCLSSRGYGFLWNNPAIGRATFATNLTEWVAEVTDQLDYWIVAGDSPAEILEAYAGATGAVPMMPDAAMGFWQCKLRYRTQEELLAVAREYKRRELPVSVIVLDYFHWPIQGAWDFDRREFPDPEGMIRELDEMGITLMVSIWPTVDVRSDNYAAMKERGYLVSTERGVNASMDYLGNTLFVDTTHPGARKFFWERAKENYYDKGVRMFWLDVAEPEYPTYDFDNYRYHLGPDLKVGNIYPAEYARTFYEGMRASGEESVVSLLRCAWAGSQRYGALVWSGDIHSSFESLKNQIVAGLNLGMAGIPWWTTDIGGFIGGNIHEPGFRELLVRWFEWGVFCPVFRLHGFREPKEDFESAQSKTYRDGIELCGTGADNEVWSFGDDVYEILKRYMQLRETLRPYVKTLMQAAHTHGQPVIRPLFYDFPADSRCWQVEDAYMFGPDLLVAPVTDEGARQKTVYLPQGARWTNAFTGERHPGGGEVIAEAPLDVIPVFFRDDKKPF